MLPLLRLYEEFDILFPNLGHHSDHRTVLHARVTRRNVLDLPGRHVLATASYAVGHPAQKQQIALLVELAEVACVECPLS